MAWHEPNTNKYHEIPFLGSASGDLLRQTAESLAGRMERLIISGFTLAELGADAESLLWERGGFPLSYLAGSDIDSIAWRKNFIQTLLERDFPQWGVRVPAMVLQRFWTMAAHYHGQVLCTEPHDDVFFWATHQGAEMDLILRRGGELFGVECQRADSPSITPSIRISLDDLGLLRIAVIYPGTKRFNLTDQVEAVPLTSLAEGKPLFS